MSTISVLIAQVDPRAGWFVLRDGQQYGPVGLEQLREDLKHGRLSGADWLWTQSLPQWVRASEVLGPVSRLDALAATRPGQLRPDQMQTGQARDQAQRGAVRTSSPASDPPKRRARRGLTALYVLLMLALVSLSLASCLQFLAEGNTATRTFVSPGDANATANALTLAMQIIETDLPREQIRLHVMPRLAGDLAQGSPRLPARDVELTLATVNGPMVLNLKRGHHVEPFDAMVALSDGDILLYPMDQYQGWIEAEAMQAASVDGGDAGRVPIVIELNTRNHAVHVVPRLGSASERGNVVVQLGVSRLAPIVFFTWFIAGVAAVIALSVGLTVLSVLAGRRLADQGLLGWTAGLLFALPAVRSSLPGAPPLGALIDYSVFFWAEALVGLSLVLLVGVLFGSRSRA